ncbi:hypothetical protein EST38_g3273 [Candolleomyces aberdarensis]|uniref:Uncharacterized protein n=1 Tax=Candolleomyces aberdarensis TaxID=2316362 RepID=A0A4Q2DSE8_9AGAR|nr:hypothetical protein EST38_g3273 [Candolleomyces aberdarensis]
MVSMEIDATEPVEEEPKIETMELEEEELKQAAMASHVLQQLYLLPHIVGFFSLFYAYFVALPLTVPRMGMRAIEGLPSLTKNRQPAFVEPESKLPTENGTSTATDINIPLDTGVQVDA